MQTIKQMTKPVKFITIVKGVGSDDSACAEHDYNAIDKEDNSMRSVECLSLGGDIWNDDSSEGCSSSDDWISFDSGLNSSFSLDDVLQDNSLPLHSTHSHSTPATLPSPMDCSLKNDMPHTRYYPHALYPECSSDARDRCHRKREAHYTKSSDISTANLTSHASSMRSDFTTVSSLRTESIPSDVTFQNDCQEGGRLDNRTTKSSSCRNLFTLPPSLLPERSMSQACLSSFESSTISTSSISSRKRKLSSETNSLALSSVSQLSSSITSSISKISNTILENQALLEDYDHSPRASRVQSIKGKLRSMEIQYYRTKCVRSLRRSMVQYMKIETVDEIEPSSISSGMTNDLLMIEKEHVTDLKDSDKRRSHSAMEIVRDILCFNLVLGLLYMFCVLYKDTITDSILGSGNKRWFTLLKGT